MHVCILAQRLAFEWHSSSVGQALRCGCRQALQRTNRGEADAHVVHVTQRGVHHAGHLWAACAAHGVKERVEDVQVQLAHTCEARDRSGLVCHPLLNDPLVSHRVCAHGLHICKCHAARLRRIVRQAHN